jgi:hypothetical protein
VKTRSHLHDREGKLASVLRFPSPEKYDIRICPEYTKPGCSADRLWHGTTTPWHYFPAESPHVIPFKASESGHIMSIWVKYCLFNQHKDLVNFGLYKYKLYQGISESIRVGVEMTGWWGRDT